MPGCAYNSTGNWWKYKREHNMWLYAFYSYRIKKIQILKLFGPIMQKRAVEQKKNLDQFHLIGIKYTMEP